MRILPVCCCKCKLTKHLHMQYIRSSCEVGLLLVCLCERAFLLGNVVYYPSTQWTKSFRIVIPADHHGEKPFTDQRQCLWLRSVAIMKKKQQTHSCRIKRKSISIWLQGHFFLHKCWNYCLLNPSILDRPHSRYKKVLPSLIWYLHRSRCAMLLATLSLHFTIILRLLPTRCPVVGLIVGRNLLPQQDDRSTSIITNLVESGGFSVLYPERWNVPPTKHQVKSQVTKSASGSMNQKTL